MRDGLMRARLEADGSAACAVRLISHEPGVGLQIKRSADGGRCQEGGKRTQSLMRGWVRILPHSDQLILKWDGAYIV